MHLRAQKYQIKNIHYVLIWRDSLKNRMDRCLVATGETSSYPGWIKSPHVVTLGILKILDLNSLTIFGWGGISE